MTPVLSHELEHNLFHSPPLQLFNRLRIVSTQIPKDRRIHPDYGLIDIHNMPSVLPSPLYGQYGRVGAQSLKLT